MKLYYARGACSQATHIALHEAGFSFQVERVDVKAKTTESGGDYRAINPKGYVPALQLDSGELLTENVAVLQYVADQKPDSGLAPAYGTMARYRLVEWLAYISSEVHKSYSPFFKPNTPDDYKPIAKEHLASRLAYVDGQLAGKQYLTGDQFTIADAYLFVVLNWSGKVGVDLAPYANIQKFQARVAQRPAVQSALEAEGLSKS